MEGRGKAVWLARSCCCSPFSSWAPWRNRICLPRPTQNDLEPWPFSGASLAWPVCISSISSLFLVPQTHPAAAAVRSPPTPTLTGYICSHPRPFAPATSSATQPIPCSSSWQASYAPGISNILVSTTQSRLNHHSSTNWFPQAFI